MKSICFALALATLAPAQEPAAQPEHRPAVPSPVEPAPHRLVHDGQTFAFAQRSVGRNVETDEYVLAGEKLPEWTQLLTVQRITLAQSPAPDAFLAFFRRSIEAEDGAAIEVLKQGRAATVFGVRFPASNRNEEQVVICLAFLDRPESTVLNVVQYAIKPGRCRATETRLKSWRDKFLQQADALGVNPSAGD